MVAMEAVLGPVLHAHYNRFSVALALTGLFALGYLAILVLSLLYRLLVPGINFCKGSTKPWAIITGPTSGIGKSFALQLAKQNFNLILVSRSLPKLESLEHEITSKYSSVECKVVDIDMGAYPFSGKLKSCVQECVKNGGDVRVLINNAGMSHDMPVSFEDMTREEMEGIIGVNNGGVLRATKDVLPFMLNDRKKKRLIINVGSFAGYTPTPLLATYSGSKAFLSAWSLALKHELSSSNIIVQHLNAYLVTTKLAKIRRPSLLIPTESAFVSATLRNLGRDGAPYWSHMVFEWILEHLTFVVGGRKGGFVTGVNKRMHEDIRRRALRKAQKAK